MQVTYGLRRSALLYGDRTALLDSDGQWTYAELLDRVQRVAGMLQAAGLREGDMVAPLMLNGHRYLEIYFGILWAGGIVVPLNTRLAPPEILFQLNDCQAKILVVDRHFVPMLEAFQGKMNSVATVIYADAGSAPGDLVSFDDAVANTEPVPDAERGGDDIMGIFYTGGTTGRSKGVMLSHDNVVMNSNNALIGLRYTKEDIYLHVAPMFHLADAGTLWTMTMAGGTHAFIPAFEPEETLKAIERYKITKIILVPTMINMVVNHPAVKKYDLSSLQAILYGASPIPVAVLQKAMKTLECEFIQGYGMTESSQIVTILPHEDHLHPEETAEFNRLKSAGQPVTNTELRIVDEDDNEVPHGTIGELIFRGPNVMKGYLNMPEATAEALRGGWMHSGDVGYMDDHGFVYLVDRSKDMIVTGGENVYSTEVEAAIYTHAAVLEAAVIGVPHEQWGEAVHAVVVLKDGQTVTEAEIISHCHTQIAGYKCPKSISFHPEALPKSGAGKILKRDLRKPFWESQDRQVG